MSEFVKTYADNVLTVVMDGTRTIELKINPVTQLPWANEEEAMNYSVDHRFFPEALPVSDEISAIAYKMLFTLSERVAIKNSTDPVVIELNELANDPRLSTVNLSDKNTIDGVNYLVSAGLLTQERADMILSNKKPV